MKDSEKRGFALWFTGLPCSGKTTIADAVADKLEKKGLKVERLDGDIVRQGLTKDLGFSKDDRDRNIERITFVAKLLSRNGVGVLVSFVSPYADMRKHARENTTNFIEVFVKCPVEVCKKRDVKGMYKKALNGEIDNFTGIDDPFEEPVSPELVIETDKEQLGESLDKVMKTLDSKGYLRPDTQTRPSKERKRRSIIKALSWRIFATFLTMTIVYIFTRRVILSLEVGIIEVMAKMLFYYFHERMWANIQWGRKA